MKRVSKKIGIKNCLSQTIVSYFLLTRAGIKVVFCIGVKKEERNFSSHSWLELNKKPVHENIKELTLYKKIIEIIP